MPETCYENSCPNWMYCDDWDGTCKHCKACHHGQTEKGPCKLILFTRCYANGYYVECPAISTHSATGVHVTCDYDNQRPGTTCEVTCDSTPVPHKLQCVAYRDDKGTVHGRWNQTTNTWPPCLDLTKTTTPSATTTTLNDTGAYDLDNKNYTFHENTVSQRQIKFSDLTKTTTPSATTTKLNDTEAYDLDNKNYTFHENTVSQRQIKFSASVSEGAGVSSWKTITPGVVVPVVFIAIVLVVGLLFVRRRRRSAQQSSKLGGRRNSTTDSSSSGYQSASRTTVASKDTMIDTQTASLLTQPPYNTRTNHCNLGLVGEVYMSCNSILSSYESETQLYGSSNVSISENTNTDPTELKHAVYCNKTSRIKRCVHCCSSTQSRHQNIEQRTSVNHFCRNGNFHLEHEKVVNVDHRLSIEISDDEEVENTVDDINTADVDSDYDDNIAKNYMIRTYKEPTEESCDCCAKSGCTSGCRSHELLRNENRFKLRLGTSHNHKEHNSEYKSCLVEIHKYLLPSKPTQHSNFKLSNLRDNHIGGCCCEYPVTNKEIAAAQNLHENSGASDRLPTEHSCSTYVSCSTCGISAQNQMAASTLMDRNRVATDSMGRSPHGNTREPVENELVSTDTYELSRPLTIHDSFILNS